MKLISSWLIAVTIATIGNNEIGAYKILGVFPTLARSHYIVGSALMRGLAEAGHEVTMISPFAEKNPPTNYTEVHLEGLVTKMLQGAAKMNFLDMNKMRYWETMLQLYGMGIGGTNLTLTNPGFKKFLATKPKPQFDVVIVEIFLTEPLLALGHYFNAPVIGVSTFGAYKWTNDLVGTPNLPSYIPNPFIGITDRMTFYQRLQNSLATWFDDIAMPILYDPKQNQLYNQHFGGAGKPTLAAIRKNVSLVLVNSHVSLGFPRPYAANMIEVGGMHVKQSVEKLPADLQKLLDGAKSGAVYFSMGSNIKSSMFQPGALKEIMQVFAEFKAIKFLFKGEPADAVELSKIASNVLIQTWFPQEAILAHPNLKLFITHGGLASTTESVYFGVPVIGIPVFGDQQMNMVMAEGGGYGIKIEFPNLNGDTIRTALTEILHNPQYANQAKIVSSRFRDQIKPPLETAIFWVEYVVRHKGCPHLRSAIVDMPFYEAHNLDVTAVILLAILAPIIFVVLLCGKLLKRGDSKQQLKHKSN